MTVADEYDDVLAIDMGARWVATCAFLSDRKTTFYGEEVRRIGERYEQLRKAIGKANPRQGQQVVERIGDAEARKVGDCLHKIAHQILADAEERNAVIVVGDLGGIRKDNDNERYVNEKTHTMPFARLLNYIEYKAHDAGIDVRLVDEYDTSKTCNRCAYEGVRETQGRFECPECGLDDTADKNGALNIGKRAVGTFSNPLSEAGLYYSSKRKSPPTVTTNLRTSPYPWVQPPVGEPYGLSRGRMSERRATVRRPLACAAVASKRTRDMVVSGHTPADTA